LVFHSIRVVLQDTRHVLKGRVGSGYVFPEPPKVATQSGDWFWFVPWEEAGGCWEASIQGVGSAT